MIWWNCKVIVSGYYIFLLTLAVITPRRDIHLHPSFFPGIQQWHLSVHYGECIKLLFYFTRTEPVFLKSNPVYIRSYIFSSFQFKSGRIYSGPAQFVYHCVSLCIHCWRVVELSTVNAPGGFMSPISFQVIWSQVKVKSLVFVQIMSANCLLTLCRKLSNSAQQTFLESRWPLQIFMSPGHRSRSNCWSLNK